MKVYIERNNFQVDVIRYRKTCLLYSRLLLRSDMGIDRARERVPTQFLQACVDYVG